MVRMSAELPEYAERVLEVAERIPPGRVMTYGDVAEWLGVGGPRQVGRVMALYGGAVPWWRVVRADGSRCRAASTGPWSTTGPRAHRCARAPAGEPRLVMRRARWDGRDGRDGGDEAHI